MPTDSVSSAQPDNRLPGNFFHFFPVHFLADLTQAGPIHEDNCANCIRLSSVTKKPGIVLYLSARLKTAFIPDECRSKIPNRKILAIRGMGN